MSEEPVKISVKVVIAGDVGNRKLAMSSFVNSKYPQNGWVIKVETTSTINEVYISASDINKMLQLHNKEKWINLDSWNSEKIDD